MSYPGQSLGPKLSQDALYEGQKRTLDELLSGMEQDARWAILVGPEGTGKTTILQALRARLSSDADIVVCDGADVSKPDDLMRVLRERLVLPEPPATSAYGGLADAVVAGRRSRINPLGVLVDNAHVLSRSTVDVLAEVVQKTSEDNAAGGGVWVVLAGRPPLEALALRARGQLKYVLCSPAPLTAGEVAQHVDRRLRADSNRSVWVASDAVEEIARCTGGIPGQINAVCDLVARRPSVRLKNEVSAETVAEAIEQADRRGFNPSDRSQRWRPNAPAEARPRRRLVGALLLLLSVVAAGVGVFWYDPPVARMARVWVNTQLFPPDTRRPATPPERAGNQRASRRETETAAPSARPAAAVRPSSERPGADQRGAGGRAERARPKPTVSPAQIAELIEGARTGRPEDVARLIGVGVPADARDASGVTALMHAVQQGHVETARVLLDKGAQINARDRGGITSAMLAVINERPDALQLLLERGADANARSGAGWTALTFAAWKGHPDSVRALLKHGANRNVVDKQGWTPLDYATANLYALPTGVDQNDAAVRPADLGRYSEVVPLLQGAVQP